MRRSLHLPRRACTPAQESSEQKDKAGTLIKSNGLSMTSMDLSLLCTKLSWIMADVCSSRSSEQRSDSSESFGVSYWDGFSSSSSNSSVVDSRTGHGKPATLSWKRAWKQCSECAKDPCENLMWQLISSGHLHERYKPWQPIFGGKCKTINNLIYSCAGGL